ncbi:tRNA (guanine(37)-N1)-methyltransferase [Gryllus bimaculatus]|nr:tRNA (guanine(37)-N1)-methyltransferase [Gryllus bimaculatus]
MFVCEELMRTSFFRRVLTCKYSFHLFKVCKMNSHTVKDPTQFLPPSEVRGMKSLDKEKFNKFIIVPWLEIDEQLVGGAMSILKKYLMKVLNIKPLRPAFELLDGEEIVSPPVDSVLVAGSKALKAKKKAKAVQGQLKKVAEMNRKKIAQVDKQLSDIHDELRHGSRKETNKIKKVVQNKKPNTSNIEISAMDKLDQLKM